MSLDFVNQHVFLIYIETAQNSHEECNEFANLLFWRLSLCLSRESLTCDTRSLDLCILFNFIFLCLWYIPPHSCAFHIFYFTPTFPYVYYHAKYFRRLVFLSWSAVGSWEKVCCVRKFRRHYPLPLSQVYWPPKKYQDIVVGLANKQCAIVLRFSPKWEQVVWTNYDPWNALSRCCLKTFTILTMKYVIVCGRINKRQTNRCQKQVAYYCPVKDDLYVTYTSWIISWNKLDKPLERRY